ncbi:MAG: LGFP repeat-containing protein [Bosea sp. (in: a-proteobacteria)]
MPNDRQTRIQLINHELFRAAHLPPGIVFRASAIMQKHAALGGSGGFLGAATGNETTISGGRFRDFANGSIYWSSVTGAFEVHGDIRSKWRRLGAERSLLGFPTTDESSAAVNGGRYNHFQGGSIYWSPATGAFEVHGDIRRLYWEKGAESFLGYPTSDELVGPADRFRFSNFQNGQIAWSPQSGAHISVWTGPTVPDGRGGLRPQSNHGGGDSADVRRRVQCHATMNIKDEENFGSDEFATRGAENEAVLTSRHPTELMKMAERMGGEIRVEIALTGTVLPGGDVRVTGTAKLFEGTSEATTDLDGQENLSFLVPAGDTVSPRFSVTNTDENDDDRADIVLDLTNFPA